MTSAPALQLLNVICCLDEHALAEAAEVGGIAANRLNPKAQDNTTLSRKVDDNRHSKKRVRLRTSSPAVPSGNRGSYHGRVRWRDRKLIAKVSCADGGCKHDYSN